LARLFLRALRSAAVSSPSGGFRPSGWPFSFCGHWEVKQFPPQVEVSGPLIGSFLRALRSAAVSSPSGGFGPSGRPFSFCWHHDVQQLFCRPYGGLHICGIYSLYTSPYEPNAYRNVPSQHPEYNVAAVVSHVLGRFSSLPCADTPSVSVLALLTTARSLHCYVSLQHVYLPCRRSVRRRFHGSGQRVFSRSTN
jgi:hypothetical protein